MVARLGIGEKQTETETTEIIILIPLYFKSVEEETHAPCKYDD